MSGLSYKAQVYKIILEKYQTKTEIVSKYQLIQVGISVNRDETILNFASLGKHNAMFTIPFFGKKYYQKSDGYNFLEKEYLEFVSIEEAIKYIYNVPDVRHITYYD
ncbi:MAG TPA: hypothetical protein V6C58_00740, partial [Allocoleopsis sp.]